MADKQEKTFDPTPQRIQKAREEGNVFQSKEITSVGSLIAGLSLLIFGAPIFFETLKTIATRSFLGAAATPLNLQSVPPLLVSIGLQLLEVVSPLFALLIAVGIGLSVLQSGWNLTFKPLAPKLNRISPLQGFKRLFSSKGLFELFKAMSKMAAVIPLAYFTITKHLSEIVILHTLPLQTILATATGWILDLAARIIVALLLLSGIDFAFEKWRYKEDLKMTKQEVEDEKKQMEGDPHMRSRQRQFAREIMRRPRLDHAVLKADVVVTNPTHYAVALRYDPTEAMAPHVLVKGIRKRALRIKALAEEHDIPTVEDRPLARALYNSVEEMQEIPEELYPAVAAILAEIYRERGSYPPNAA